MTPDQGGGYNSKELLPLDGDVFREFLMGLPLVVKPLPLEVGTTAKTSRRICVQVQVVGVDSTWVTEVRTAVPVRKEGLPPNDISQSFLGSGGCGGEVVGLWC